MRVMPPQGAKPSTREISSNTAAMPPYAHGFFIVSWHPIPSPMVPTTSVYTPEQIASAQLLADSLDGLTLLLVYGVGILMPVVAMIRTGSLWKSYAFALTGMLSAGVLFDFVLVALVEQIWPGILHQLTGKHGGHSVLTTELRVLLFWPLVVFIVITPFRETFIALQRRLHRKPAH
jgi:hypothetical protein